MLVGHQTGGGSPPLATCVIQAGLIDACAPLASAAYLAFTKEAYMRLSATTYQRRVNEQHVQMMLWLLPVVHAVFFFFAIYVGLSDLSLVGRGVGDLFCYVDHLGPSNSTGVAVLLFIVTGMGVAFYTAFFLWREKIQILRVKEKGVVLALPLFMRTAISSAIGGVSAMLAMALIMASNSLTTLFWTPIPPLSVALIFGFQ